MRKFDPTNLADGEMIVKEIERRMAAMMIMASITERQEQTSTA